MIIKCTILASLSLCIGLASFSQTTALAKYVPTASPIIPAPVSLHSDPGSFILPKTVTIEEPGAVTDQKALATTLDALKTHLSLPTGYSVTVGSKPNGAATIRLLLNKAADTTLGAEGYFLKISPQHIILFANQPAGLFYGVQTLLQLFPKEIESLGPVQPQVSVQPIVSVRSQGAVQSPIAGQPINWSVPCMTITDYPRFSWRGLMFDVSRHFFTKDQVKKFIDEMVRNKFNLLHLHLTDDQGWRIEIKSLPKLTTVGAWNVRRVGSFGTFAPPAPDEPRDNGGFFTQDDIRELVRYAKDRFVNILPEVDVPGHSLAAIASYPELSCTEGAENYRVNSGDKFMIWPKVGHFYGLIDNTLCPANEKVYDFLDKVFTEIAQLFPFGYIHVGGDEGARNFWEKSTAIRQLMQKEGLKNMDEVQSYFEKRVEKIVESKGKKLIGWDEILEGGLAPNAVVMSWRGINGGIEAAKMGHQVVMSPKAFVYLDYMQGDSVVEPPVYASLRLKTCYSFEPVPDSVDPKFILGGQGNLWTEQVYNMRHLEYMVWPRSLAIAESVWSPKEKKDWNSFTGRVELAMARMDEQQIKYARSMFDPIYTPVRTNSMGDDSLQIQLSTEVEGLDLYYSFDNSNPDNFYPRYHDPLTIPKEAIFLKVVSYRDGRQIGKQSNMPIAVLRRRVGLLPKP